MTKIIKKTERLENLKHSVLETIYKYCIDTYADGASVVDEVQVWIGDKLINVKVYIAVQVLVEADPGDYFNPPTKDEIDFHIVAINIEMILNDNCIEMPNITNALQKLLWEEEGQILNY